MPNATTALVFASLLVGTATAQQIKNFNISTDIKSMYHDARQTSFSVSGEIPAVFPKPARSVFVGFDCQNGYHFSTLTAAEDSKLFDKTYKSSGTTKPPFIGQVNPFKFSCPLSKATVTSPKLWETLTMNETPSRLAFLQQSLFEHLDQNIIFSKNRGAIVVRAGLMSDVYNLEGGNFKVLQGSGAVSVSQGGKPEAVFLKGSVSNTVKINLAKPFVIHTTRDQGETWQNISINFPGNTMSFWGSLKNAGGPVPAR